ncbi:1,4-butanediol diacrylate esterase [Microbacterium sp. Y-01]|uniref:serine hydrolase domain-containing protein n=1 Tax=Microbacterium sp. Y-01 TaxID=2048898 RepID=UPI000F5EC7AF|nr:serine hydrolase domain-containing protein [Microbacterium sp. Y-01]AZH79018.1 1,4-butanediol diacrylate esterase [Microbacterium sp. Y-01]
MPDLSASAVRALDQLIDTTALPGVAAVVTGPQGVLYRGSGGRLRLGEDRPFAPDSVIMLASATKAVTATALLQLIDEGAVEWDEPATTYLPELGRIGVLTGRASDGTPLLRPPRRPITPRTLLLHTSGFAYDNFNPVYAELLREGHIVTQSTATRASLSAPLLFDPGERWEYGLSSDWIGQLVEAVRGARLSEVIRERILDPLEMPDTAFTLDDARMRRRATVHRRDETTGELRPTEFAIPEAAEIDMGGHGLYSTVDDYARFLRMWLNGGKGPAGRVLSANTVRLALTTRIGGMPAGSLRSTRRSASLDVTLFPGLRTSWSPLGMVVLDDAPTGRRRGAVSWAGLANVYFWIDPESALAAVWATQVLPFGDPTSLTEYLSFERAVYSGGAE